jgi:hypothetical protein
MVLLNVSALFVYEPGRTAFSKIDLGRFGVFHWGALATLGIIAVGYVASTRQMRAPFAYLHPICMVVSYYLLIAGSVNEFYARVVLLSGLAQRTHGAAIGLTHVFLMLLSFGVVTYFVGKVAAYRETEHTTKPDRLPVVAG